MPLIANMQFKEARGGTPDKIDIEATKPWLKRVKKTSDVVKKYSEAQGTVFAGRFSGCGGA